MKILILAGGSGSRLWPHSRKNFPKQFLNLDGNQSFLQKTVERFLKMVDISDIWILTNHLYEHDIKAQLKKINPLLNKQVLFEPQKRNTAPAIAFALEYLRDVGQVSEKEVILVAPSDHLISPEDQFIDYLNYAEDLAKRGKIVTFGIHPYKPETGYGYVQKGIGFADTAAYTVQRFVEKPDLLTAKSYLLSQEFFWNSGMFAFPMYLMYEEYKKHAPSIGEWMHQGCEVFTQAFSTLPDISIDYAIMEKTEKVVVLPLELTWSDIGSWDNLYEMWNKDAEQNVCIGDTLCVDTKNSLVFADKRLVCTLGLEDTLIIDSDDALLVAKLGHAEQVKGLVAILEKQERKQVKEHLTVQRPWGNYTKLEEGNRYQIKKILVHPGEKLSLQMHYHRSEHWVVTEGTAKVVIGEEEHLVHENGMIYVPKSAKHRLENPGKVPLVLIEIQVGEYLQEDDIVRFDDVYGRAEKKEQMQTLIC